MRKYTLTALLFTLLTAASSCAEKESKSDETIKICYFPGFQDFSKAVLAENFHLKNINPSDTIFLDKNDFRRIKDYIHSDEAKSHNTEVDVRMVLIEGTDTAYMGACLNAGNFSDYVMDMEYLVKEKSKYYDYFDKSFLESDFFKEVLKNGIPADYRIIDRAKSSRHEELHCVIFRKE